MRIAVDALVLGSHDTGVGIWIRGLVGALGRADTGHDFLIYHGRHAARLPALRCRRARYVPLPVGNANRLLRVLWEQARLPARLQADRVDVLHSPAYVAPLRCPVPTVVTVHDLFALTNPEVCKRLNGMHFRRMIPPSLRHAAVVQCSSRWTCGRVGDLFPDVGPRACVVPPAADEEFTGEPGELDASILARYGLDRPPFLFVGNVEPKKRVDVLLRAYARLGDGVGTGRRLLLVGGPGWRNRRTLGLVRELGLAGHVARAGYVPREHLPALYRQSLALVFPSDLEGFGLPPLEAMACGTPVVCTRTSGLCESADDAALFVPPGDPDALADAMRRVETEADLRARLRAAGLKHAHGFRWADRVPEFIRLYERAAGRRRGRH